MRPFIQHAVSYFIEKSEALNSTSTDSPCDAVVAGYSCSPSENQQELSQGSCNRRQVGILYADIADYSRLTELDEEGTHHRMVESMGAMKAYISANNGKVAHVAGDAILAEFRDADSALNCAVSMQLSDRRRNALYSSNQQIRFRIGVNFGDVIADHGDIYGNAVNLAARLEGLAHTGGVCVSESVRARLRSHPSFKFIAMGKQYMKNISDPVEVFWIEFGTERIRHVDQTCMISASAATL